MLMPAGRKQEDGAAFFKKNADVEILEAFVVDVNGVLRGKWIPAGNFKKVFSTGMRLPRSAHAQDIWGQDVFGAGFIVHTGDTDGVCIPVAGSLKRVPWLDRPTAQVMLTMEEPGGKPFFGDPRQVLQKLVNRAGKMGLTPVGAAEMEFYLIDARPDENGAPQPPRLPRTGRRQKQSQTYGMSEVRAFDKIFSGIVGACKYQGIPVDTIISENGPGQCEITIKHTDDLVQAADHAVLMKRIVKGVAQQHGMDATFMAKPYAGLSGNGMHVHMSMLDRKGKNVFAGKKGEGSAALLQAIGGLLKTMPDSMAVFAPHLNSYRRFQKNSHARHVSRGAMIIGLRPSVCRTAARKQRGSSTACPERMPIPIWYCRPYSREFFTA
jgi:glutamine synthetase